MNNGSYYDRRLGLEGEAKRKRHVKIKQLCPFSSNEGCEYDVRIKECNGYLNYVNNEFYCSVKPDLCLGDGKEIAELFKIKKTLEERLE